jgi:hypothetical protein
MVWGSLEGFQKLQSLVALAFQFAGVVEGISNLVDSIALDGVGFGCVSLHFSVLVGDSRRGRTIGWMRRREGGQASGAPGRRASPEAFAKKLIWHSSNAKNAARPSVRAPEPAQVVAQSKESAFLDASPR